MSVGEREGRRNRGFTESKKKTQINKEVENKAMTKVYGVGRFEVLEGLQKSGVKNPTQWDVSAVNSYCFGYILIPTPEPRTIQIYHIPYPFVCPATFSTPLMKWISKLRRASHRVCICISWMLYRPADVCVQL